jgi:hypothetical protein
VPLEEQISATASHDLSWGSSCIDAWIIVILTLS